MTATSPTRLDQARALELPTRDQMLRRDPAVQRFWQTNRTLLVDAWHDWEAGRAEPAIDETLIDPGLRTAVGAAWADPTTEAAVLDRWEEAAPGVYRTQFFDLDRLAILRAYLDAVADAGIPLRPPYGIVLNRAGAMLDPRSEGHLAAPGFQAFYELVLERYMRPIARLLYPEVFGFDTQTFGFSINYRPTTDTAIRPHTDASSVTLNINMNLEDEAFGGSAVDFFDPASDTTTSLTFAPGTALIHRGHVPHMAHPITEGERSNLVLWLTGDGMQTPRPGAPTPSITPTQRWSVPDTVPDGFAPF